MDGLLLIDKPAGPSSFDIVRQIRRVARTRKVGHTGTLDPAASGLLPIVIGRCTRLANFLTLDRKAYAFEMVLGVETDSGDDQGEVVRECAWEGVERSAVEEALGAFRGSIEQVPPIYSAIKIDGVRAYERARRGEEVELEPRPVEIDRFEIVEWRPPVVVMEVGCSSGTYVRSLARDLGDAAGSCAHARRIRRLVVGDFRLEQAVALDALTPENVAEHLLAPAAMVASLPSFQADPEAVARIVMGQFVTGRVDGEVAQGEPVAVLADDGELVAIAIAREPADAGWLLRPKKVLVT